METANEPGMHRIDARELRCPYPFILSKRETLNMKAGDRLEVLVRDENTLETVGLLAQREKMDFTQERVEDYFRIILVKRA